MLCNGNGVLCLYLRLTNLRVLGLTLVGLTEHSLLRASALRATAEVAHDEEVGGVQCGTVGYHSFG
jgi:hypothetical protein